jgi:hypothetical protein
MFQVKKILNKTDLEKSFKKKILILGTLEQILNFWKKVLMLPLLLIYFMFYCLHITSELIAEHCFWLGETIRDLPDIRLHSTEEENKMVNAIKKSQNMQKTIDKIIK